MNQSESNQRCPECGLDLPAGTAATGCPGCSLRLALLPEATTDAPAAAPAPPSGLKSRFFADYEILSEVARGGMGVVFRARQLGLNRVVALKMVQSHHLLSDEARLRFQVEIEAVAQLHHPHIVSLYESGEQDGTHFFTMRLVEGGDLGAMLQSERPLRQLIRLLVKVCRAVHYAHQRGILHRDLKPSNILVDEQGEPHVADFGLAKSLGQDTSFTFTSSVLGSPNYMAPEQATGRTLQLTTAVDVYGLGAILYHILAGRPPFQAKTPVETLRQVVDHDPVPPHAVRATTDADLETIALKCLRKEPTARYGSAEEVAQDLERWLDGRPILARPLGIWALAWRWSRRHPAAAALGAALALAIAVIGIGTALVAVRIQRAERQSAASLRESLLREAGSLRLAGELGHRTEALRLIKEAAALGGPPEFRTRARNELLATLARTELEFIPFTGPSLPAHPPLNLIHPRFQSFAHVEHGTNVVLRALVDGAIHERITVGDHPVTRLDQFSPDGRFLALWQDDEFSVWEMATGAQCVTATGTNLAYTFHPKEDVLLLQTVPNEARWLALPSGSEKFSWTAPLPRVAGRASGWHTLTFSPDGRTVAGASGTSQHFEILDARTGTGIQPITNYARHVVAMTWDRRSNVLANATHDSRILLFQPATKLTLWTSPAMVAAAHSLAFHPNGNWLAAACGDETIRLIDVTAERFIFEFPGEARRIAFSPDGTRLGPVRHKGKWGWIEFRRPPEFTGFAVWAPYFRLEGVRFSADGRILATGHADHVMICDADHGTRLRNQSEWRMSACLFHPNGRDILAAEPKGLLCYQTRFTSTNRLVLGNPKVIQAGPRWRAFDCSPDGRFFAAVNGDTKEAGVFDHTLTNRLAVVPAPPDTSTVAVSPDGRWLAISSRAERGVQVWEVSGPKLLRTLPAALFPRARFSPDGRWLAVTGENTFDLLETGTWQPAPSLFPGPERPPIQGAAAFSPDSRWLALVVNRFVVHLFDLRSFQCLGVLHPPVSVRLHSLAFSPEGSRLAAVGDDARVAVWNLRGLERQLAAYALEWDPSPHAVSPAR